VTLSQPGRRMPERSGKWTAGHGKTAGPLFQPHGGSSTVVFTEVAGWMTPTNRTVVVILGQTTVVTVAYVQELGNLQVTLSPAGAIILGAQWQLDNGPGRIVAQH